MPTLYVTEPGARIEKEYGRVLVTTPDDEVLFNLPLVHVSEIVLVGSVGVTTQALLSLLDAGVGFSIISGSGRLRGRLVPPATGNIFLRQKQYERGKDAQFCLEVARSIALGKLRNQRTMARRIGRTRSNIHAEEIDHITHSIKGAEKANDLSSLRGQEGRGAKRYFHIFRLALHSEWEFGKRTRRPPADPVNAILGFGYNLLAQNMMTALEVAGLDPYDGFLHADIYGRPALALDLMEEFRTLIVDSTVLTLLNKHILGLEDFVPGPEPGIRLKPNALKKFLLQYNARLQTRVFHPLAGRAITYQKCLEVQARQLRHVVEGKASEYKPFLAK